MSPKLLMCRDLELAVPGTYDPNQPIIRIQSIAPSLQVITSKQRPRKLTLMGKDACAPASSPPILAKPLPFSEVSTPRSHHSSSYAASLPGLWREKQSTSGFPVTLTPGLLVCSHHCGAHRRPERPAEPTEGAAEVCGVGMGGGRRLQGTDRANRGASRGGCSR